MIPTDEHPLDVRARNKSENDQKEPKSLESELESIVRFHHFYTSALLLGEKVETEASASSEDPKTDAKLLESQVESMIVPQTSVSSQGAIPKTPKKEVTPVKEKAVTEKIVAQSSAPLAKSSKKETVVEPKVKPKSSHVTGDKGNVHYGKELEKPSLADIEASVAGLIEPASERGSSGKKTEAKKVDDKGSQKAAGSSKVGDKDSKKSEKGKKPGEKVIKPKQAPITGDKGNIHYAKELEKGKQGEYAWVSLAGMDYIRRSFDWILGDKDLLASVEACIVPAAQCDAQAKPSAKSGGKDTGQKSHSECPTSPDQCRFLSDVLFKGT